MFVWCFGNKYVLMAGNKHFFKEVPKLVPVSAKARVCMNKAMVSNPLKVSCACVQVKKKSFLHNGTRAISSITLSGLYVILAIRAALFWIIAVAEGTFTSMSEHQTHICTFPGHLHCTSSPIPSWSWEPASCRFEGCRRKKKEKKSSEVTIFERWIISNCCVLDRDNTEPCWEELHGSRQHSTGQWSSVKLY